MVNLFTTIVQKELLQSKSGRRNLHLNISNNDVDKIKGLGKNNNIVIKRADKGNSIVILDTVDYLREGLRQLSDNTFYQYMSS